MCRSCNGDKDAYDVICAHTCNIFQNLHEPMESQYKPYKNLYVSHKHLNQIYENLFETYSCLHISCTDLCDMKDVTAHIKHIKTYAKLTRKNYAENLIIVELFWFYIQNKTDHKLRSNG